MFEPKVYGDREVLHECHLLENATLKVLGMRSIGPRILSLEFAGGKNLFAELPNL